MPSQATWTISRLDDPNFSYSFKVASSHNNNPSDNIFPASLPNGDPLPEVLKQAIVDAQWGDTNKARQSLEKAGYSVALSYGE
jgi:phosphoglucomutase